MPKNPFLLSFIILLCLTSITHAADTKTQTQTHATVEIPAYAQKIRFQLPLSWKHAYTNQTDKSFIIEFIPKNESIDTWTNLFSMHVFKQTKQPLSPEGFADNVARNFGTVCSGSAVYAKLGARKIGKFDAFEAIIGCAKMPLYNDPRLKKDQSEISFFTFIKGQKNLYFTQKSYRSEGFGKGGIPSKVQQAMAEMQNFLPIELCALTSPKGKCDQ